MALHVERHPAFGRVIWARKLLYGRLGTYTAVRLRNGRLSVAIRHPGSVEWLPADRALTEGEAVAWAHTGF